MKIKTEREANKIKRKYDDQNELLSIYCQYSVDTGLVECVNNIMTDQLFAQSQQAYAVSAIHMAHLKLLKA
jgi:hypothetical protein